MQLGGLEEHCKLPSGSGQSPEWHLMQFWSENALSRKALNAARGSGGAL